MGFTENFNYCMSQRNYSAYRFGKLIGANNQSVINWENGATLPRYSTRLKIAEHFGITLEALEGDELPALPSEAERIKNEPPDMVEQLGAMDKRWFQLTEEEKLIAMEAVWKFRAGKNG